VKERDGSAERARHKRSEASRCRSRVEVRRRQLRAIDVVGPAHADAALSAATPAIVNAIQNRNSAAAGCTRRVNLQDGYTASWPSAGACN